VTIDQLSGTRLPYIDNLVNLIVVQEPSSVAEEELLRVLCPEGVAVFTSGAGRPGMRKLVKPRPAEIDDWPTTCTAPPTTPCRATRSSGRRGGCNGSAARCTPGITIACPASAPWCRRAGRVFSILDEATPISILAPPKWSLIARDAFNGTILWRRPIGQWHTHLWPLKSGPAQLPRRLVASDQTVYVTLQLDGPLMALDAATGETVRTYEQTAATEEILLDDGTLFLCVNPGGPITRVSRCAKHLAGGARTVL
jgi:hypothetical protein